MKIATHIALFLLPAFLLNTNAGAQSDSANFPRSAAPDTLYKLPDELVFKPTVGLGAGMFTFYGDVANNYKGFHPLVSRVGFDLNVTNPLTNWLDLGFYVIFGKISANERSPDRNLNFESRIRTGGAVLSYNFRHILPEKHHIEPFVFTGFESFEFLSKTDLFDKYGNYYYYWDDGSIRNMDQADPNANNAVIIHRDYTYESDLREQNIDGFGKYRERSWSVPVGAGVQFILGDHLRLRIGASMHFTFTDLVDNVTPESIGNRKGNSGNDKFLYSYASVHYDLMPVKHERGQDIKNFDPIDDDGYYVMDTTDLDKDGVRDFDDHCLYTKPGVKVDEKGCPLDNDRDLVWDYLDDEKPTPKGNFVDARGVTLTDEDIYLAYLMFKDSTGEYHQAKPDIEEIGIENGLANSGSNNPNVRNNLMYYVVIGSEKKQISANDLSKYLGFKDFKTIESGDTVFYVLGNYTSVTQAVNHLQQLEKNGIDTKGIAQKDNKNQQVNTLNNNQVNQLVQQEKNNTQNTNTQTANIEMPQPGKPVFRVQIGAYNKRLPQNVFKDVPDVVSVPGPDGVTRYYSGYFTDSRKAAEHQVELYQKGYKGAFIAAFKDGKRISLNEAGVEMVDPNDVDHSHENDTQTNKVDPKLVKFKVNLGEFKGDLPAEMLDVFLELDEVRPRFGANGQIIYLSGSFSSFKECEALLKKVQSLGVNNAFIQGEFNNRLISADEAKTLLGQ